jgi:DNA-directed RNA polymerase subunit beta'
VAGGVAAQPKIEAKHEGILEIDELRTVSRKTDNGKEEVVIGRSAEMRIVSKTTKQILTSANIPYGAILYVQNGATVKKGELICDWDAYNAVIISELDGTVEYESIEEGITYRIETDDQTGYEEKVIIERKDKNKNPALRIVDKKGEVLRTYNVPAGSHIIVNEGEKIGAGTIIAKIPRSAGKTGDITGGLPRVTELFEARNPSNPATVSEIDGVVTMGKVKRGNREITVESKTGEQKKYLVSLAKHILVQENDFVKAGQPLTDGAITPTDILNIKGPTQVQEYLVNEVQEVYRMQGVRINDKHFEVIVRQMMKKALIIEPGDTTLLEGQLVNKIEIMKINDAMFGMKVVVDPGDSTNLKAGQIISARKLRDENSMLRRKDLKLVSSRDAIPATSQQVLQGITRASLQTDSWISAASFQETTKVLNEASIRAKVDYLEGLKENVIVGHLIPAGTGLREYEKVIIGNKDELEKVTVGTKLKDRALI